MIRLIQRRLIIPRGDTGAFNVPYLKTINDGDVAVFTIFDCLTQSKMYQKVIAAEGDVLNITFSHNDTVNLKPGKYLWDIKFYTNPQFLDDELVNGDEIDSYYAGYTLPVCEIRETGDDYLVSDDAPTGNLSPEQLDIITAAINALNDAIDKTNTNVEHYPQIRDEVWYIWDAQLGDYVSTGVRANGIVGNGIASAVLNNDYTLTLNFTDGTSYTSPSIRGNGIEDIVLNSDYTLTIIDTDGAAYTTPSIRGPVGATPNLTIGTVQEGPVAAATITGTPANPVLNLTLPNADVPTKTSQLENDSDFTTNEKVDNLVLIQDEQPTSEYNKIWVKETSTSVQIPTVDDLPTRVSELQNDAGYLTTETDPTVPAWAKAAQKPSYTAAEVGAPTIAEMNTAIGTAIGNINSFDITVVQTLPTQDISTHTIYLVPKTGETNDVYDEYIYINNNWEMVGNTQIDLSNYVQKTDYATSSNAGVVKIGLNSGLVASADGSIVVSGSVDSTIKSGANARNPITPKYQHTSTFYGLAKAAGADMKDIADTTVGTYPDAQKEAIQSMLGITQMLAPENPNLVASQAYAIGDVFAANGHLYKATAAIAQDGTIIPDTNCVETTMVDAGGKIKDVQVAGTSVVGSDGVANMPIGRGNTLGVIRIDGNGFNLTNSGLLQLQSGTDGQYKSSTSYVIPVVAAKQHVSTFYGLSKVAGVDLANETVTLGAYPETSKIAIKEMLGVQDGLKVVRLI